MNLRNLRFSNFPVELDYGIPYVLKEYIDKDPLVSASQDELTRTTEFWKRIDQAGFAYSRGMLLIPMGGTTPQTIIRSKAGRPDWSSATGTRIVANVMQVLSAETRESFNRRGLSPEEGVRELCEHAGLLVGSIFLVIPLQYPDLARWSLDKNIQNFVRGSTPAIVGLWPQTCVSPAPKLPPGHRTGFLKLEPPAFDLAHFSIDPAARDENWSALFIPGCVPRLNERLDVERVQEAQKIPVPLFSDRLNKIAGPDTQPANLDRAKAQPDPETTRTLGGHKRNRDGHLEEKHPELWATLYPRRYADISGYLHPRQAARITLEALTSRLRPEAQGTNPPMMGLVIDKLREFGMTHYFIAPTMLEAVMKTKFPEELTVNQTPVPCPAFVIILPLGQNILKGSDGSPLQYIYLSIHSKQDNKRDLIEGLRKLDPAATSDEVASAMAQISSSAEDELRLIGVSSAGNWIYELPVVWPCAKEITAAAFRKHFADLPPSHLIPRYRLLKFILNLLLYLSEVPQYIERARVERTAHSKKPQLKPTEFWRPNIYGRTFAFPPQPAQDALAGEDGGSGKPGRSPRPHLRWAHWRWQRHGAGFSDIKLIRIDFAWVNSEKDTDADPEDPFSGIAQ